MNTNDPYGFSKHQKKQALKDMHETEVQMKLIEILQEMKKISNSMSDIEKRMEQYEKSH